MSDKKHSLAVHSLVQLKNTNKFLFLKRSDYKKLRAGLWGLPGGSVEYGEQISGSMIREYKEEAGITLNESEKDTLKIIGTHSRSSTSTTGNRSNIIFFYVEINDKSITLSHEHTEFKRLSLEEALQLEPRRTIIDRIISLYTDT